MSDENEINNSTSSTTSVASTTGDDQHIASSSSSESTSHPVADDATSSLAFSSAASSTSIGVSASTISIPPATVRFATKLISDEHADILEVKLPLYIVEPKELGYCTRDKEYKLTGDELEDKLSQNALKLTKQLLSWRPEYSDDPWFAFRVSAAEIERCKIAPDRFQSRNAAELLIFDILGTPEAKTDDLEVKITPIKNTRKTAWPTRYYFSDGRVHSKALAKVKAATNQLYASCIKDSICIVKFYTESRAWYWPPVILVGYSKMEQGRGGLFGVLYEDTDQEHLHHGN